MIAKVVRKGRLAELQNPKADLEYWLSKTSEERIVAVEHLRRQRHGNMGKIQKVVRVIRLSEK